MNQLGWADEPRNLRYRIDNWRRKCGRGGRSNGCVAGSSQFIGSSSNPCDNNADGIFHEGSCMGSCPAKTCETEANYEKKFLVTAVAPSVIRTPRHCLIELRHHSYGGQILPIELARKLAILSVTEVQYLLKAE